MAIPWVQVYSNLLHHPKTGAFADALALKSSDVEIEAIAVGILVSLWTWAVQNAPSGDLSAVNDRTIARESQWKRKPETLVDALTKSGFLDADRKLHDWEEYAELYINRIEYQREQAKERMRNMRARKKAESENGA